MSDKDNSQNNEEKLNPTDSQKKIQTELEPQNENEIKSDLKSDSSNEVQNNPKIDSDNKNDDKEPEIDWDNIDEVPDEWKKVETKEWNDEAAKEGEEANQKLKDYEKDKHRFKKFKDRLKYDLTSDSSSPQEVKRRHKAYFLTIFLMILLCIFIFWGLKRSKSVVSKNQGTVSKNSKLNKIQDPTIQSTVNVPTKTNLIKKSLGYFNNYEIEQNNILIKVRQDFRNYLKSNQNDQEGDLFNNKMAQKFRALKSINPNVYIPSSILNNDKYKSLNNIIQNQYQGLKQLIIDLHDSTNVNDMIQKFNNEVKNQNTNNSNFLDTMQGILKANNIKYSINKDNGNITF